jgi:hypothetical protein
MVMVSLVAVLRVRLLHAKLASNFAMSTNQWMRLVFSQLKEVGL